MREVLRHVRAILQTYWAHLFGRHARNKILSPPWVPFWYLSPARSITVLAALLPCSLPDLLLCFLLPAVLPTPTRICCMSYTEAAFATHNICVIGLPPLSYTTVFLFLIYCVRTFYGKTCTETLAKLVPSLLAYYVHPPHQVQTSLPKLGCVS